MKTERAVEGSAEEQWQEVAQDSVRGARLERVFISIALYNTTLDEAPHTHSLRAAQGRRESARA